MPRLLRMAARTAVVAGTASAVSGRVQHRQANRWAGEQQPPAAPPQQEYAQQEYAQPPAAPSTTDTLQQLKDLGELKAQGVLTEEEFAAQKAKILAR
jgi:hypothetical protein